MSRLGFDAQGEQSRTVVLKQLPEFRLRFALVCRVNKLQERPSLQRVDAESQGVRYGRAGMTDQTVPVHDNQQIQGQAEELVQFLFCPEPVPRMAN